MPITLRATSSNATTNDGGSFTINKPVGTAAGDVLIAIVEHTNISGSISHSPPAGWTQIQTQGDAFNTGIAGVWYKVAGSSEPASYTWTYGGAAGVASGIIAAYDGVDNTTPVNGSSKSDNVTCPTFNTTVDNCKIIFAGSGNNGLAPTGVTDNTRTWTMRNLNQQSNYGTLLADDELAVAGAVGAHSMTTTGSGTIATFQIALAEGNEPPTAPTLVSPANASFVNLGSGGTFDWTPNDPDAGDTQSAYAFRRKITGAPSYEYWNAGTSSWQGTEVKNTSAVSEITFAAGKWTNGNTYNWSVKTWDSNDDSGPYASDFTVSANNPPTVTVIGPTGTITDTTSPIVTWSYSDLEGDIQTHYQVVVESGAYGTSPGSGTGVYDSGVLTSTATNSKQIPLALTAGVSYRVFVRATQTGGGVSAWAYNTFTITLDEPAPPIVTAVPDDTEAFNLVTIQGQLNMLTANQASLETDTAGWAAGASTSIARSTVQALKGSASLQLTRNSTTGTASAVTPSGTSGVPVVANTQYTAIASFRPNSTTRSVRVSLTWYDSGGAVVGTTAAGASVAEGAGAWVQATVTATSHASAAYARVTVEVLSAAATEMHYIDAISFHPGTLTTWYRGGLTSLNPLYSLERSEDAGDTWVFVRDGTILAEALTYDNATAQTITVEDHEAILGVDVLYRSFVEVFV